MTAAIAPLPPRRILIVGLPRSGTSLLHAMACTAPGTGPYMGEASYLRMVLGVHEGAQALFEAHNRYLFESRAALRDFHRGLVERVLKAYGAAQGDPDIVIMKDPLLTGRLRAVAQMAPDLRLVMILRHPCDTIASRLAVQRRMGRDPDPDRIVAEHVDTLNAIEEGWDEVCPQIVTYPMVSMKAPSLLEARLGLTGVNPDLVWKKALKRYPQDAQPAWTTPLYGERARVNVHGRKSLPPSLRRHIDDTCLPGCLSLLRRSGLTPGPYWNPSLPPAAAGRRAPSSDGQEADA